MREILFRGKAINRDQGFHRTSYKNGEWVYGLITRLYDDRFENLPSKMTDINGVSGIEIDYKTIGQYTGLTDKNGQKIFEGDVVHLYGDKCDPNLRSVNYNALVVFKDGGFCAIDGTPDNYSLRRYNFVLGDLNCEVIGNIYDNPELLEELR